eukprot:4307460-Pleurochrysis_carterae.AAC.2
MSNQPLDCMRRTSFCSEEKPLGKEMGWGKRTIWSGRERGLNVRDIERRRWTPGEVEGHDNRAAQVPNAPACSLHKAGLS